jgi:hypothetical protein
VFSFFFSVAVIGHHLFALHTVSLLPGMAASQGSYTRVRYGSCMGDDISWSCFTVCVMTQAVSDSASRLQSPKS